MPDMHEQDQDDGHRGEDRHGAEHGHQDRSVEVDQLNVTTYLRADNNADGSGTEHFILDVNSLGLDGQPAAVPGFGSQFGLYFLIDTTGQTVNGVTTFNTMDIKLMVDAGNDDGAPSSTVDGGIAFANGTSGDFALATGTLVSATLATDPDGSKHPNFVQTLTPTAEGQEVFGASLDMGALLKEVLTTPGGAQTFPADNGGTTQIVNGCGFGSATLSPQAPLSLNLAELAQADRGSHGDLMAGCFR